MIEFLRTLVAFAIVLGVLVFFHELGHYLAARWAGIKVEVFSIGFGPKLASWTDRHETSWQICALPLGGYVKMHGMEQPQDVPEWERAGWHPDKTFQGKSVAARSVVVAAGPVANFLLAVVLFFGLFASMGRSYITPSVQDVVSGGPAAAAGVKSGDVITAIGNQPIVEFEDLQRIVSQNVGHKLIFTIRRKSRLLNLPITPMLTDGTPLIGIRGGSVAFQHLSLGAALVDSVTQTYDIARDDLVGIGKIFTGPEGRQDLSSVIGIAQLSGEAARQGIPTLINFIAFVSVSLGLINLFPIPILDGGHLLFFAAEAIRGKPLSPRLHGYALYFGLSVIAALMLLGVRNDLGRLGVFSWATHFF